MTKQMLMYLVHFHVYHSFVHHHSWTKTVAMMTQITWLWVISPTLDMEKEKQKNRQLRLNYRMNTTVFLKSHEEGGFWTEGMGRHVCVKLWIHFIAGDTSGHNNLVGHMNGGQPEFIYQDCRCLFDDLSNPIPMCYLITSQRNWNKHIWLRMV